MDRAFIPCELCDVLVDFNQYMQHLEECQTSHSTMIPFGFSFSNLQNDNLPNDSAGDAGDERSDNEEDVTQEEVSNSFDQFRAMMNNLLQHMPELTSANNYDNLRNLEDVIVPCKDIDKVAPLIPSDQTELIPDDLQCPVCQEIVSGDARKTICGHYFCSACLEPWLEASSKTCPICSVDLDELYQKEHPEEKYLSSSSDSNPDSLEEFIQNELGGYLSDPDDHQTDQEDNQEDDQEPKESGSGSGDGQGGEGDDEKSESEMD